MRIDLLPAWTLTDLQPAFYDSESATVLQQMAKVYAKMQELLNDYNAFVNETNNTITKFQSGIITDFNEFKNCIIKTMNDYIATIDTKVNNQDTQIANAINYMKDNLVESVTTLFNQALQNGDIRANLVYNADTEALTILLGGSV